MNDIMENLRKAHEAANNTFSILSDVTDLLREASTDDSDLESQIEDLTEIADKLQASLFDLLEDRN